MTATPRQLWIGPVKGLGTCRIVEGYESPHGWIVEELGRDCLGGDRWDRIHWDGAAVPHVLIAAIRDLAGARQ